MFCAKTPRGPEATIDSGAAGPVCSVATIVRTFCRRSPAVAGRGGAVVVVVVDAVVVGADVVVVDARRSPPDPDANHDPPESPAAQATAPATSTDAAPRLASRTRLRTPEMVPCHPYRDVNRRRGAGPSRPARRRQDRPEVRLRATRRPSRRSVRCTRSGVHRGSDRGDGPSALGSTVTPLARLRTMLDRVDGDMAISIRRDRAATGWSPPRSLRSPAFPLPGGGRSAAVSGRTNATAKIPAMATPTAARMAQITRLLVPAGPTTR